MLKDYSDPLLESKKFLENPSQMGILVEHAVCGHFLRLTTKPTLYYHLHKQQNRTLGEIDCICHYRHTYIPIEVKYTENEEILRKEAEITNNILNDLNIKSRPIIVSKNTFEIQPNYAIIPANTFLLLF
jgi:predicted AAA+ superfamily ATPase